jgi:hypothetical protein
MIVDYDFAILRVVPRVHTGAFANVGIVLHARTAEYLAMRAITDVERLARLAPGVDSVLLAKYLRSCEAICAGDASAGPVALAPTSERFHWLTAPRSDVIQSSPVHEGICEDPRVAINEIYTAYVGD